MAYIGSPAAPTIATVSDGTVTSNKLADDAVTSAKLDTNIAVDGNLTVDTNTLYVDSTNNRVGIGTTIPSYPLDVNGNSRIQGGSNLEVYGSNSAGTLAGITMRSTPRFCTDTGTFENTHILAGATYGNIIFSQGNSYTTSSNTERMRIDSSGNVLISTTSAIAAENVNGVAIRAGDGGAGLISIGHISGSASGTTYAVFRYNGGNIGTITQNGTTAVSYNTSSDYRLKENVVEVSDGIDRVKLLKPSRFNFIADPNTTVDGFLAHEVSDVVPEAITGTKDAVDADGNPEYQGIDQSKLVPLLTAALQEAITKIESLETEMITVKSRLDALESA